MHLDLFNICVAKSKAHLNPLELMPPYSTVIFVRTKGADGLEQQRSGWDRGSIIIQLFLRIRFVCLSPPPPVPPTGFAFVKCI